MIRQIAPVFFTDDIPGTLVPVLPVLRQQLQDDFLKLLRDIRSEALHRRRIVAQDVDEDHGAGRPVERHTSCRHLVQNHA